ncbi:MAG TPA: hypothetical protein DDY57_13895 [Franconibacter pulveris]|nr:hypothetical protein [Franconibacter pulveris]
MFHFHDLHTLSPQKSGYHKKNRRIIPLFQARAIRNGLDRDQANGNQSAKGRSAFSKRRG